MHCFRENKRRESSGEDMTRRDKLAEEIMIPLLKDTLYILQEPDKDTLGKTVK